MHVPQLRIVPNPLTRCKAISPRGCFRLGIALIEVLAVPRNLDAKSNQEPPGRCRQLCPMPECERRNPLYELQNGLALLVACLRYQALAPASGTFGKVQWFMNMH